jgi:hypothetical protein
MTGLQGRRWYFFVWDEGNEHHLADHRIRGKDHNGMGSMKKRYDAKEWDESRSVRVTPEPRMRSGISTSIRLPKEMVAKLRKIAKKKGNIGYQTLLKIWIAERLEQESA